MVGLARGGSRIRGSRIGAGPIGEDDRGESAERTAVAYFCSQGHQSRLVFALQAPIPEQWECPRCGQPAGRDQDNPPAAGVVAPYKTHLAYVRERRSDAEAEILLGEALARLRGGQAR
jgi:hypothetical protein